MFFYETGGESSPTGYTFNLNGKGLRCTQLHIHEWAEIKYKEKNKSYANACSHSWI
jgi:ribonucleotide reductase beta subunit family protein with ferritin-like domain